MRCNRGLSNDRVHRSQIVSIRKQVDAGGPVKDICRQAGISVPTYRQWKSEYDGMEASGLRCVKELEPESAKRKTVGGNHQR